MRFKYDGVCWHVEEPLGWDRLPVGTRPSHIIRDTSDAFSRPPIPQVPEEQGVARCDTNEDYELALVDRLAVGVAQQCQRSVELLRGHRRFRGALAMRGLLCLVARALHVRRETLAHYMGRRVATISSYTSDSRASLRTDSSLRRAYEQVTERELEADACSARSRCSCLETGSEPIAAGGLS